MKKNKYIILIICLLISTSKSVGAYLEKVPITLKQPNGVIINCYATGDEFYSRAHDADNYTIVQDSLTGYYCYAIIQNNKLVASKFVVGIANPSIYGLTQGINLSNQQIKNTTLMRLPSRQRWLNNSIISRSTGLTPTQAINNIVVYIRFADQSEFPTDQSKYSSLFNDAGTGKVSMYNYFNEVSYGQANITSTFYPTNNGSAIISYKDAHIRDFYRPKSITNDSGYCEVYPCYPERENRENALVMNAINFVKSQIPASLNLDGNMDGYVDNICFVIKGSVEENNGWNKLLWPHMSDLPPYTNLSINSKLVKSYNFQFENSINVGVLCHEMGHTLGAPDLYHYTDTYTMMPIGTWDLMCSHTIYPTSVSAYTKYKWLGV